MKRGTIIFLIVAVANLQLAAHVELNTPEGGETYHSGDMVTITWTETVSHKTLDWDLLFSNDGGQTWISLKADIPKEVLSYQWLVPDVSTMKGKIKVIQDNEKQDYESTSQNFTVVSTTGIRDPEKVPEIEVYPNPFTEYATINFENPDQYNHTLTIYNARGGMVRSITHITSGKIVVQRGNLMPGHYFIQLRREKQKTLSSGKLVIQ
ncbi:MAG: T9SS type A sorting domain-containing protein [Bacteroides sp.]|nr:T9SS type A sorting domain-containing protein [Bacteroides sp.]